MSEQPEPRHTLGDDSASTLETKRTMSNVLVWRVNEAIVSISMMRACKNVQK